MDSNGDLETRSEILKKKLSNYKSINKNFVDEDAISQKNGYKAYSEGFRMVIEFTSAIVIATLIGYFIDTKLGSLPFGLIIGLLLGFVTGIYNLIRSAKHKNLKKQGEE